MRAGREGAGGRSVPDACARRRAARDERDSSDPRASRANMCRPSSARARRQGRVRLDQDTAMSPGSYEAALRAAGGAAFAVDEVMSGKTTNAFVATRPPGHHAELANAMGFCFFNNAAVAARHAQAAHGAERVAIVDFDVHHGNGTQHIFWADNSVLYASTHEMPLYPGTGARSERGEHDQIVNAPLSAGDGGDIFREALRGGDPAARRRFRARPHHHFRGLRRALPRSARQPAAHRGGFRLGDARADEDRLQMLRRSRGFAAGGRLRPAGPVALGRRACHGADGKLSGTIRNSF